MKADADAGAAYCLLYDAERSILGDVTINYEVLGC
jgi:hypothetical protein